VRDLPPGRVVPVSAELLTATAELRAAVSVFGKSRGRR
jgi:hypothetical protein